MTDSTTPQDSAAMSPASTGSVAGEPDAWMHISGGLSLGVFKHVDKRLRHLCVPLYRSPQPVLADDEQALISRLAEECEDGHPRAWTNRALTADDRATLRGLLERLK